MNVWKNPKEMTNYNILFVCTANKTRSPTLASLLMHLSKEQGVKNLFVDSCGIKGEVIEKFRTCGDLESIMAGRKVRKILLNKGIKEIQDHRVKKISELDIEKFNLIV